MSADESRSITLVGGRQARLVYTLIVCGHCEEFLTDFAFSTDCFIHAFSSCRSMHRRKWITKFGSGGPAWDKGCDPTLPPREHNREALFNVYEVPLLCGEHLLFYAVRIIPNC